MEQIFTPQDCPQVPPFGPSCEFGAKSPESRSSRNECDEWHFSWNFLRQVGKTYGLRYLVWLANLLCPFFAWDLFGNFWTIQLFAYLVWASNHVPMTNIPKSDFFRSLWNFSYSWGGKRNSKNFRMTFFLLSFFFFLIVLQGIVITLTNIIDLVLQTIFCMTSLPNSITSNIISRGRRQQSRRRQQCSRRQRQRQLRGSEVPRAGLGEEDFFSKTLSFRLSFCYRFGLRFSYVFLHVEASMQCNKKRITRRAGSKWKLSNCWLYKTYI